jgi:hypothetical protein
MSVGRPTEVGLGGTTFDLLPTHLGWLVRKRGEERDLGTIAVNGAVLPSHPDKPDEADVLKRIADELRSRGLLSAWSGPTK